MAPTACVPVPASRRSREAAHPALARDRRARANKGSRDDPSPRSHVCRRSCVRTTLGQGTSSSALDRPCTPLRDLPDVAAAIRHPREAARVARDEVEAVVAYAVDDARRSNRARAAGSSPRERAAGSCPLPSRTLVTSAKRPSQRTASQVPPASGRAPPGHRGTAHRVPRSQAPRAARGTRRDWPPAPAQGAGARRRATHGREGSVAHRSAKRAAHDAAPAQPARTAASRRSRRFHPCARVVATLEQRPDARVRRRRQTRHACGARIAVRRIVVGRTVKLRAHRAAVGGELQAARLQRGAVRRPPGTEGRCRRRARRRR